MFRIFQGEVGVTLVSVMLILLLMTILGAGLLTSALMENKIIHGLEDQKQAFYLAQAGVEYARFQLQKDLNWRTAGFTQALGKGNFTLVVTEVGGNQISILSTGQVGGKKKTLQLTAQYSLGTGIQLVQQMAQYSVVGGGDIIFANHTVIQGMGNVRSNGDVTSTGGISVDGQVIATGGVQASLDPAKVREGQTRYAIPGVKWADLRGDALSHGRYLTNWNENLFRDDMVNFIDNAVILTHGGAEFSLDGVLVILGDFIVSTKTKIDSQDGLMIFVDGRVVFENQTEVDAAIYATGPINFRNKTVFTGAIYSEQTISATNNTLITLEQRHLFQTAVYEVLEPTGTGVGSGDSLTFTSWLEVKGE